MKEMWEKIGNLENRILGLKNISREETRKGQQGRRRDEMIDVGVRVFTVTF